LRYNVDHNKKKANHWPDHNLLFFQGGGAMSGNGDSCACGGSCGCGGHSEHADEVYLTRDEYVARLEQYLQELKAEIQAVEAELVELRQAV
jgi:hypothetical protein